MTMKNSFVSAVAAPVAALALMAAPQKADATSYLIQASGTVSGEADFSNVVDGSVLAPGSAFSFSGIFDSSLPAISGTPGLSQTYLLSDLNFTAGLISGTAGPGRWRVFDDHPAGDDRVLASFSSSTPGFSISTSGLDAGTDMTGAQFTLNLLNATWNTTAGDAPFLSGALLSAPGTFRMDFGNASGQLALFVGDIHEVRATVVHPTSVPDNGSTLGYGLLALGGLGLMYGAMRDKSQNKPVPEPVTLG